MTYVFDIDGTICYTNNSDYENSKPIMSRIEKVNTLYDEGNTIIFQNSKRHGPKWKFRRICLSRI